MASFLHNFMLIWFCLLFTHLKSAEDHEMKIAQRLEPTKSTRGLFALVKDLKYPQSKCGAVWINGSFLLTAASCFKQPTKKGQQYYYYYYADPHPIDVVITQFRQSETGAYNMKSIKEYKGKAVLHPRYSVIPQNTQVTTAYDFAVVKAELTKEDEKRHTIGILCKEEIGLLPCNEAMIAIGMFNDRVAEWELKRDNLPPNLAVSVPSSYHLDVLYFKDKRKQFTLYLNVSNQQKVEKKSGTGNFGENIYTNNSYGGPVLDRRMGCVAGIMSFAGRYNGKHYITSTKVYPALTWIEYTMNFTFEKKSLPTILMQKVGLKKEKKKFQLEESQIDPIGDYRKTDKRFFASASGWGPYQPNDCKP